MGLSEIMELVAAGVAGLLALYGAFHAAVKAIGAIIPGEDKVEDFGDLLDEKIAPIIVKIEAGVDLLNPRTSRGAGYTDNDQ